ncbi:DNA-directed RNA polymerase subunit beta [Nocardia salmonicida]|uniref:DNA-directed RNA polymerase subunit beta n=1 Tax=Nocardia salmonicida TaxID=53431 RepID=UPI0012F51135|nr:DNA-directed RNA polymerase subunit beta [Nocardia salmonicida]
MALDSATERILLTTGRIVGITMPGDRGQAVANDMKDHGFALGPIVGNQRSGRWTFLVRADLPNEDVPPLFTELFRLNVSVVRNGAEIALPASRLDQFRHWVEEPRDTFRPSGLVVVDSVRRTTKRGDTSPNSGGVHNVS